MWEAERSDDIQQRHLPADTDGVWFLPQPVSGEFLPIPRLDGNLSQQSEEAVTVWRYAVLESDDADTEGHQQAQERVSNPALVWLRNLVLAINEAGDLNRALKATDINTVCDSADIAIPGLAIRRG